MPLQGSWKVNLTEQDWNIPDLLTAESEIQDLSSQTDNVIFILK